MLSNKAGIYIVYKHINGTWKPVFLDYVSKVIDAIISPFTSEVWIRLNVENIIYRELQEMYIRLVNKLFKLIREYERSDIRSEVNRLSIIRRIVESRFEEVFEEIYKSQSSLIHKLNDEIMNILNQKVDDVDEKIREVLRKHGFIRVK